MFCENCEGGSNNIEGSLAEQVVIEEWVSGDSPIVDIVSLMQQIKFAMFAPKFPLVYQTVYKYFPCYNLFI